MANRAMGAVGAGVGRDIIHTAATGADRRDHCRGRRKDEHRRARPSSVRRRRRHRRCGCCLERALERQTHVAHVANALTRVLHQTLPNETRRDAPVRVKEGTARTARTSSPLPASPTRSHPRTPADPTPSRTAPPRTPTHPRADRRPVPWPAPATCRPPCPGSRRPASSLV